MQLTPTTSNNAGGFTNLKCNSDGQQLADSVNSPVYAGSDQRNAQNSQ